MSYELKKGAFNYYIYDTLRGESLDLKKVVVILNDLTREFENEKSMSKTCYRHPECSDSNLKGCNESCKGFKSFHDGYIEDIKTELLEWIRKHQVYDDEELESFIASNKLKEKIEELL